MKFNLEIITNLGKIGMLQFYPPKKNFVLKIPTLPELRITLDKSPSYPAPSPK